MFNHWATGLRSGLLPQDCEVATQKLPAQKFHVGQSFREGVDLAPRDEIVARGVGQKDHAHYRMSDSAEFTILR